MDQTMKFVLTVCLVLFIVPIIKWVRVDRVRVIVGRQPSSFAEPGQRL